MIVGIDHVLVAVPPGCEAQARSFYGQLLELSELPKPPVLAARGGLWFALGAQQLHLGIDGEFAAARTAHPAPTLHSTAALDALAGRLAQHGHEPRWDAELPAARRFYVDDPFGNRLELLVREH
jgi:hypothetical protein